MTLLHLAGAAASVVATAPVRAAGDVAKTGEAAKSGPIGFAVILVLCVACYFLFKSMSRHLRKVREEFPADEPTTGRTPASTGPASSAAPPTVAAPPTAPLTGAPPAAPGGRARATQQPVDPAPAPERTPET